jgi:hypothetical protein
LTLEGSSGILVSGGSHFYGDFVFFFKSLLTCTLGYDIIKVGLFFYVEIVEIIFSLPILQKYAIMNTSKRERGDNEKDLRAQISDRMGRKD